MLERLGEPGRLPFVPGVRTGDTTFLGGILPDTSSDPFPHHSDPLARHSEALLTELERRLRGSGVEPGDVLRLDQWFVGPGDWPAGSEWSGISITRYMEARQERFPSGIPASVAVAVRRLPLAGALVGMDALASTRRDRETIMPPGEEDRAFPAGVRAGDRVYLSGELPTDWKGRDGSAVAPEARVDPALWYGYPARAQTEYLLRRLSETAEAAGSDFSRAVHATVFLADRDDFVGFEEAWRDRFAAHPPARTVVPGAGLACRGCRVEVVLDLLTRSAAQGPGRLVLDDLPGPPGCEAHAVLAGDLLYVSGQLAVDERGLDPQGLPDPLYPDLGLPAASQMEVVLRRIEEICARAGTGLDNLVRLRLFLPDLSRLGEVFSVWGSVFGGRVPTGTALGVGPPLVPGSLVAADAVAWVPGAGGSDPSG